MISRESPCSWYVDSWWGYESFRTPCSSTTYAFTACRRRVTWTHWCHQYICTAAGTEWPAEFKLPCLDPLRGESIARGAAALRHPGKIWVPPLLSLSLSHVHLHAMQHARGRWRQFTAARTSYVCRRLPTSLEWSRWSINSDPCGVWTVDHTNHYHTGSPCLN